MKIVTNEIRCLACGDIIQSTSEVLVQSCRCGKVLVKGGLSSLHRVIKRDNGSPIEDVFEERYVVSLIDKFNENVEAKTERWDAALTEVERDLNKLGESQPKQTKD